MMEKISKIYIAGRNGLVGSSIEKALRQRGYQNIIGLRSRELDLRRQQDVETYFERERPHYVILAAAKVGSVLENTKYPAEFLYDNLMIQSNIIHCAYKYQVKKLLFLGTASAYPATVPQPLKEEYLLAGKLEANSESYAIAKIAGLKMCEKYNRQYGTSFIGVMPCNVYGVGDRFKLGKSHVVPSLIMRFHEAKICGSPEVFVWGTGNATRELIFNEDLADACLYLFENDVDNEIYNIGTGREITIRELADLIKEIVGYQGQIIFDPSKPDGIYKMSLDVSKLNKLGWTHQISLEEGLRRTYAWYLQEVVNNSG